MEHKIHIETCTENWVKSLKRSNKLIGSNEYLNRVAVLQVTTPERDILVTGPHVNSPVQLPEGLLPRVPQVRLLGADKIETARTGVEQWQVILVNTLIQAFPMHEKQYLQICTSHYR